MPGIDLFATMRSGRWARPQKQPQISMPASLEDRLPGDAPAAFFGSLARTYRRRYMAWVETAKRQATRDRRADEALELLRRGEKLGMC